MRQEPARRHPQRFPMQDYRNRDYCQHLLDDRVFDAFNKTMFEASMATTGCLDALDEIPAGSMVATYSGMYDQSLTARGVTAAEIKQRNEFAARLMAEILADEAN